ncbi:hypothetical protein [Tardiphaga sp.]|uniref:bestrophin-like domain n=1 Tax=Tardiphaga sp. TaxID=1926292 RepID=UPI00352A786E
MIRAWLELNTFGTFATLALLYYGGAVVLVGLTSTPWLARRLGPFDGIVAPFFSSVAILFGLLTGFLANDVGDRNRQAVRAVQTEAGELRNIHALSIASASDMTSIRVALKAFVTSEVQEEWPAMLNGERSPHTRAAFDDLLREISDPKITREASAPVHVALLSAAVRAGTARNDRLSLSNDHTNDLKWTSVLLLGLITQLALCLVHFGKPRAMLLALSVFGSGAIVALGLIALQEHPFEGTFRVSPEPLERILTLSEVGPNSALPAPPK